MTQACASPHEFRCAIVHCLKRYCLPFSQSHALQRQIHSSLLEFTPWLHCRLNPTQHHLLGTHRCPEFTNTIFFAISTVRPYLLSRRIYSSEYFLLIPSDHHRPRSRHLCLFQTTVDHPSLPPACVLRWPTSMQNCLRLPEMTLEAKREVYLLLLANSPPHHESPQSQTWLEKVLPNR